jgi:anti-sigma B factor antagonist
MALKLTNRDVDEITIVALAGDVVLGEESRSLRDNMKTLLDQDRKKLVLDMSDLSFIDSSGLGALVAIHHSAKASGASLRLCCLGAKFKELLRITGLLSIFHVSSDEAEAIHSFAE